MDMENSGINNIGTPNNQEYTEHNGNIIIKKIQTNYFTNELMMSFITISLLNKICRCYDNNILLDVCEYKLDIVVIFTCYKFMFKE